MTPTLALSAEEHELACQLLADLLARYEQSIPQRALLPTLDADLLTGLLGTPFPGAGRGVRGFFDELEHKVLAQSTTVAHPRFLAYVLGPPNGIAPYADAIAATINQNCNFWQLSPAASVVERAVVSWLGGLFGYGVDSGGILTSGGSIATLNALTTALHDRRPNFRTQGLQADQPPLIVYTSVEAHRCVDKAAAILGLGLDNVRHIATDQQHRMDTAALQHAITADRAAGLEPFCVVATAGTVTSGAIDPLADIGERCRAEDLWFHIDGAYGALFILTDSHRGAFAGADQADSIALDPHKLLFAPLEAGCLVVREQSKLARAYAFSSSYLTVEKDPMMLDYMNYGPELSRGFKALKVWAALQTFGIDAFKQATEETLRLADYLGQRILASQRLELLAPVTLTAVCFAMRGASPAQHTEQLAALAAEGTALLGPAVLGERHAMRACITNYRTTRDDIDRIVERLEQMAAELQQRHETSRPE